MNRVVIIVIVLLVSGSAFLLLPTGGVEVMSGQKVFRFPLEANPPNLDPVKVQDVTSDSIARKIFNGLIRYDKDMRPAPDLAEAIPEWNAATNSYTFKLRKGVKFHNGREVKAADVKYSWERLLDPEISERLQILEPVVGARDKIERQAAEARGIEVLDDYTVRVTLTGPSPTFLCEIGMVNAAIVPREAVEAAAKAGVSFGRRPVGTGPFKLVKWRENCWLELARHDDYFKGRPKLDRIVFEVIPDPQARLDHFTHGGFEVCDIPFGRLKNLREEHPEWIAQNPTFRTNYLGIAIQRPLTPPSPPGGRGQGEGSQNAPTKPLGVNLKLRQAINHAINRQYITDVILEGRGQPAYSILPPGMMAHDPGLKGWSYDPAKAKALLAEASYPEGAGLPVFALLYRNDPDIKKIVLAIHSDLEAVGIHAEMQALDWGAFLDKVGKDPPDLFYLGWIADYNDPDNFLYYLFDTRQFGSAGNETRYANVEVDRLLELARATMDQAARVRLYQQAERIIVGDCPWVIIENRVNYILLQPNVRGVKEQLTALDVGTGLSQVDFGFVDILK